jgi:hypothetical protein
MRLITASIFLASLTASVLVTIATTTHARTPLVVITAAPPAGLSVEAKDAPFDKGFDFKFKSDTSTATISIDPLGNRHTDSGSISSKSGSISLSGKYSPHERTIVITAKRSGSEIGEYSWRVEAVLR